MIKFNNHVLIIILAILAYMIVNIPVYAMHATITDLPGSSDDSKVAIKKTENSNFVKARVNDLIRENGIIVTGKGADSQVELLIEDDSSKAIVRLGSQSYLKLTSSSDKVKLLLDQGKVLVQNTGSLNLNIYVGNYVASSEGTTFTVDVVETGDSSDQIDVDVEVLEGKVRFNKDNDDIQKAYYILPGEKAKFNLKFKKSASQTIVKDKNIEKLENTGLFDVERINNLNRLINEFNSSGAELENTQFQKVKIEMNGPLFTQFKAALHQDNLEKVKQNQELQNQGQLEVKNNERRQNLLPQGHPQLNNSSIDNIDKTPVNEGNQIIDDNKGDIINRPSDVEIKKEPINKLKESSDNSNIQRGKINPPTSTTDNGSLKIENNQTNKNIQQNKLDNKPMNANTKRSNHSNTVILSSPSSSTTNTINKPDSAYYNRPKKNKIDKQQNNNALNPNKQSPPAITRPDIDRTPGSLPSDGSLPSLPPSQLPSRPSKTILPSR